MSTRKVDDRVHDLKVREKGRIVSIAAIIAADLSNNFDVAAVGDRGYNET